MGRDILGERKGRQKPQRGVRTRASTGTSSGGKERSFRDLVGSVGEERRGQEQGGMACVIERQSRGPFFKPLLAFLPLLRDRDTSGSRRGRDGVKEVKARCPAKMRANASK